MDWIVISFSLSSHYISPNYAGEGQIHIYMTLTHIKVTVLCKKHALCLHKKRERKKNEKEETTKYYMDDKAKEQITKKFYA